MWSIAASVLSWALGLLGFGKKDERDIEREAGRKLGQQETQNDNAQSGLSEIQSAVQARDRNIAELAADPERLRDGSDPAATEYKPGPD
jgi:hypothetical protein